jgi:hypothetical protein
VPSRPSSITTTSLQTNTQTPAPKSSSLNAGTIAGGVVGGIVGWALICFAVFIVRSRLRQRNLMDQRRVLQSMSFAAVRDPSWYDSPELARTRYLWSLALVTRTLLAPSLPTRLAYLHPLTIPARHSSKSARPRMAMAMATSLTHTASFAFAFLDRAIYIASTPTLWLTRWRTLFRPYRG